jgi:hypothetical protein
MGVVPMLYAASWLMTAFSADFPIAFSARCVALQHSLPSGPAIRYMYSALRKLPLTHNANKLTAARDADRIMDVLLGDQCECALLKVAVAVMKAVEPRLLEMNDLEDVLGYLKIEVPGGSDQWS